MILGTLQAVLGAVLAAGAPVPAPVLPTTGGGAPVHVRAPSIPSVTAVWDLALPLPVFDALGYPTEILPGTHDLPVPVLQLRALGHVQAVGNHASWALTLPSLTVDTTGMAPRPRSVADPLEEQFYLLQQYLVSLKDE